MTKPTLSFLGTGGTTPVAPTSGPIQRLTMAGMALERLREKILRGDYPEGEPLRQDAISAELGVSRIPVREALRRLEAEGLVVLKPHIGAIVTSLSRDEIVEVFELRALLEGDLLLRAVPCMEASVIEEAESILDSYEEAFASGDPRAWGILNRDFHFTLVRAAARPITEGIVWNLHNQCDRYTRIQLSLTHGEERAAHEHRAILDAVRRGDAEEASGLLRMHILEAGTALVASLPESGTAPPPTR